MPRFIYECLNCGKIFEKLLRSSDEKVICPNCNSDWNRKKFTNSVGSSSSAPASPRSGCG